MLQLNNIFADFMYSGVLEGIDNETIVSFLENLEETEEGVKLSNNGGYQTDLIGSDRASPELIKVADCVYKYANEIANFVGFDEVKIAAVWGNINRKNCYNLSHFHPDCVMSAVYYPRSLPNQGDITFKRDNVSMHYLLRGVQHETDYSRHSASYTPVTGELIIFPAWLEHQVGMNETDTSRVSVAFNIVLADMQ